jgi:hypothetical protein
MAERFSQVQRAAIRRALQRYKDDYKLGREKLAKAIEERLGLDALTIDDRTLERFLKDSKETLDATIAYYKQFAESLDDPEPIYDLGDAIADFYELPEGFAERKAHMQRMRERHLGRYEVWDFGGEQAPSEPLAELRIKEVPHSPFFEADEVFNGRKDDPSGRDFPTAFEGLCLPRGDDLLILLKELGSWHEKFYIMRAIKPDDVAVWHDVYGYIGNVVDKRLNSHPDPEGNMASFYRVHFQRILPDDHVYSELHGKPTSEEPEYVEAEDVEDEEISKGK